MARSLGAFSAFIFFRSFFTNSLDAHHSPQSPSVFLDETLGRRC